MPLQFRRGTTASIAIITPVQGEPVYATDTQQLFIGDGSTAGGVAVGGNQSLNTTSNVTFNSALISTTATVATLKFGDGSTMTTAPTSEANQSLNTNSNVTFSNLTVTNRISFTTATNYIQSNNLGNQAYSMSIRSEFGLDLNSGQSPISMSGAGLEVDTINQNDAGFLTLGSPTTFSQTATIQQLSIGLNNELVTIPGTVTSATSMLVQPNPASGGHIFFNMNRFGVAHPIAFARNGSILLESGQTIGPAFGGGMNITAEPDMSVFISSGNYNAGFTADDTLGAQLSTYNVGLDAPNIAGLDPYGVFTTPQLSVSSTATFGGNIDGTEGFTANMTGFRAGWYGGTSGYAFKSDTDTGMFGWGAGDLRFKIDGTDSALVDSTGWEFSNSISVTNTATIQDLSISLNNELVTITGMVSSATSMLVQTNPVSGGNIFFNMNRFGVSHPIGFARNGSIFLESGQTIGPAYGGGLNIVAEADMGVYINSGNGNTSFVADDTLGAQLTTYNVGLDAPNIATLDPYGVFTTPALAVTSTATVNEIVVGPDLRVIKSIGYNVIGVEGNWHVGNVLEVGTDDGQGYITSTGNNSLTLQTSGNNGPGGSIVVGHGDGAGVQLFSGNSQEFATAQFNTTTNIINYGLTVNGPAAFTSPTTLAVFTATGLTAISGAVGQIAIVSNSSPGGMMAFWDTTNSRWAYVHDNSAV